MLVSLQVREVAHAELGRGIAGVHAAEHDVDLAAQPRPAPDRVALDDADVSLERLGDGEESQRGHGG